MASPARSSLLVGAKSYDALKLSSQIDSFQDLIYWRRSVETGGSDVKTKLAVLGGCVGLLTVALPAVGASFLRGRVRQFEAGKHQREGDQNGLGESPLPPHS